MSLPYHMATKEGGWVAIADSLEELYRRHIGDAIRLAFLLTHDLAAAEDLAQEAFLRVAQHLGQLRHQDAFWTYLRRTLIRMSIRRMRRERHLATAMRAQSTTKVWQPDISARDEMWRALGMLAGRQRTVLVLRYYEDLNDDEISQLVGCKGGTVRSLAARGLKNLRERIEVTPDG